MVGRVMHMEKCMERVQTALQNGAPESARRQIETLRRYMDSGQWLRDYEADERGEIPKDLKRGVLSEDGLYDLLCEAEQAKKKS